MPTKKKAKPVPQQWVVIGDSALELDGARYVQGDVLELDLAHAAQLVRGGHVWALKGATFVGVQSLVDPSVQAVLLDHEVSA